MNKIHKSIWSHSSGSWVAVSEVTKSQGKSVKGTLTLLAVSLLAATGLFSTPVMAADPGIGNIRPAHSEFRKGVHDIDGALATFRSDLLNPTYYTNSGTDASGNYNSWITSTHPEWGCSTVTDCGPTKRAILADYFQDYSLDLVGLRSSEMPSPIVYNAIDGSWSHDYTEGGDYNKAYYDTGDYYVLNSGGDFQAWSYGGYTYTKDSNGGTSTTGSSNSGVYRDIKVDNTRLDVNGDVLLVGTGTAHSSMITADDRGIINFSGDVTAVETQSIHLLTIGYYDSNNFQAPPAADRVGHVTVGGNLTLIHGVYNNFYDATWLKNRRTIIIGSGRDLLGDHSTASTLDVSGDLVSEKRSARRHSGGGSNNAGVANVDIRQDGIMTIGGDASILSEADMQDVGRISGNMTIGKSLTVTQGSSIESEAARQEAYSDTLGEGHNYKLNGMMVSGGEVFVGDNYTQNIWATGQIEKGATEISPIVGLNVSTAVGSGGIAKDDRGVVYVGGNLDFNIGSDKTDDYKTGTSLDNAQTSYITGVRLTSGDLKVEQNASVNLQNTSNSTGMQIYDGSAWVGGDLTIDSHGKNNVVTASKDNTGLELLDTKAYIGVEGTTKIDMQTDSSVGIYATAGTADLGATTSSSPSNPSEVDFKTGSYTRNDENIAKVVLGKGSVRVGGIESTGIKIAAANTTNAALYQVAGTTVTASGTTSNAVDVSTEDGTFDIDLAGTVENTTTTTQSDYAAVKMAGEGTIDIASSANVTTTHDNIALLKTDDKNITATSEGTIVGSVLFTGAGENNLTLSKNSDSVTSDIKVINGGTGSSNAFTIIGDAGKAFLLNAYSGSTYTPTGITGEHESQLLGWDTVNLTNNSRLNIVGDELSQGAQSAITEFNIDATSTLSKTHLLDTTLYADTINNKGTVDLRYTTVGSTDPEYATSKLTMTGNYVGTEGSKLLVNTIWNNAATPTESGGIVTSDSTSDYLVIDGTATGRTEVITGWDGTASNIIGDISFADWTNPGTYSKLTVPVVTVNTDHDSTSFPLTEQVFYGNANTTNAGQLQLVRDTANPQNYVWTIKAEDEDIYNPETPGYGEVVDVDLELGYGMIGTLHERQGEPQVVSWDQCGYTCDPMVRSETWGRIGGKHLEKEGEKRLNYDADMYFFQVGQDLYRHYDEKVQGAGSVLGVMGSYGRADVDYSDKYRAVDGVVSSNKYMGSGKVESGALGAYYTKWGQKGAYLDLVGQVSYLRNTYKADSVTGRGKSTQDGYGFAVSAEVGAPYRLGNSHWSIEPQAQLIYQWVTLDDFHDGTRLVKHGDTDGLRGRLGARFAYNAPTKNLRTKTFYGIANVYHDFMGNDSSAWVGRDIVGESYNDTWYEVGVGAQLPIGKSTYIYGDARYEHSFSGAKREGYRGSIGLKFQWH